MSLDYFLIASSSIKLKSSGNVAVRICNKTSLILRFSNFQACRNGLVTHLEHLLFYGADMNAQNASGNSPLHVCAVNNQVKLS